MTRCPVTYKKLIKRKYSLKGLRTFSNKIVDLKDIDIDFTNGHSYSSDPHTRECFAQLQVKQNRLISGDKNNRYIIVCDNNLENQYIFNRDLTMKLATISSIKTVVHGLAYHQNGSKVFWYKRPQFYGRYGLLQFDPLINLLPGSSENIFEILNEILNYRCTFPALEKLKLLRLLLFSFLTGNQSISATDLSLIKKDNKVEIAPHHCLINNTIYLEEADVNRISFLDTKIILENINDAGSVAGDLLGVNLKAYKQVMEELNTVYLKWLKVIEISFIKNPVKKEYLSLLRRRRKLFFKF